MQALPPAAPRRLIHERRVLTRGFLRDDGLWDIEGGLVDEKSYTYADRERGPLPAGSPMHHMRARLTVDNELMVRGAQAAMPAIPFTLCSEAAAPAQALIGASLAQGFRRKVEEAMGATRGCTHLRDLLLALATTAFQTVSAYREQHMPELGAPKGADGVRPFFLHRCRSWDEAGPVVARFLPQFHRGR